MQLQCWCGDRIDCILADYKLDGNFPMYSLSYPPILSTIQHVSVFSERSSAIKKRVMRLLITTVSGTARHRCSISATVSALIAVDRISWPHWLERIVTSVEWDEDIDINIDIGVQRHEVAIGSSTQSAHPAVLLNTSIIVVLRQSLLNGGCYSPIQMLE